MVIAASQDLRDWVGAVEALGQLERLKGIHWDLEIGGLLEIILEKEQHPPALLFEDIPDSRRDMRVLCSQLDTIERLALAMGTQPQVGVREFIESWRKKLKALKPTEPEFVQTGPVLENCIESEMDITAFPVPRWHELDGGRYIGTGDLVVTQDPEEGWINAGTYRVMVHGPKTLARAPLFLFRRIRRSRLRVRWFRATSTLKVPLVNGRAITPATKGLSLE